MAMSFLKPGMVKVIQFVDKETGEIIEEQTQTNSYVANSKEQFFLGYFELLDALQHISGPAIKVYFYLLINYKSGVLIGINKVMKKAIQGYTKNKSLGSINNCITELCRSGLLIKKPDELAGYYINPRFAYIGNSKARLKALQMVLTTVDAAA